MYAQLLPLALPAPPMPGMGGSGMGGGYGPPPQMGGMPPMPPFGMPPMGSYWSGVDLAEICKYGHLFHKLNGNWQVLRLGCC